MFLVIKFPLSKYLNNNKEEIKLFPDDFKNINNIDKTSVK